MLNFENLDKGIFPSTSVYGFPDIIGTNSEPMKNAVPANDFATCKRPEDSTLHFYQYDYKFIRFWNQPDRYIKRLREFGAVIAPDFSMYTDMPLVAQMYNKYRKHWLAAYWQSLGINVYPCICWSTPESYEWCFDSEPKNSIVSVSSVGCMRDKNAKKLFMQGHEEMMKRLDPTQIIWFGTVPEECDWNIIRMKTQYDPIVERRMQSGR